MTKNLRSDVDIADVREALWESAGAIRLLEYAKIRTALDELETLRELLDEAVCCCGLSVATHLQADLNARLARRNP